MAGDGKRSSRMTKAVAAVVAGARMSEAASAHGVTTRGLRNALKQDGVPTPPRGRPRGRKPRQANAATRRRNRLYQAAHRESRRSYKTDAENLGLLLLWEAGELSEGQVARAFDIDRVTLRMMREGAMAEAMKFAEVLLPPNAELSGAAQEAAPRS